MSDDDTPPKAEAVLDHLEGQTHRRAREMTESVSNVPRWWRVTLARFDGDMDRDAWARNAWRERDGSPLRYPN